MKPLVSIVIPVLNGVQAGNGFLQQSIFSAVTQDYEGPIEIVVIDDGSRDETVDCLNGWSQQVEADWKSRKLLVFPRPHEGVTRSLNAGLRRASGELIARQDADDWSQPNRITRQVDYLSAHPEIGLVGSAVRVANEKGPVQEVWYRASGKIKLEQFKDGSPLAHGSVMFRRSVIDAVGEYDPRYQHAQDYDLFWRIAKQFPIATVPDPLYNYRVHKKRVTANNRRFIVQRHCANLIKSQIRQELRNHAKQ